MTIFNTLLRHTLQLCALAGILLISSCESTDKSTDLSEGENPYTVERTFPDYLLEHRKLFTEQSGIYQAGEYPVWTVHSPDEWIGNITFIETPKQLIAFDCSVSIEGATHALKEIRKYSDKPIRTIFYSHHHTDHYNGTKGLVNEKDVASGKVKIYAWDNFMVEKLAEFGTILNRQTMGAMYFSGALLDPDDKAYLSCCGTKTFGGTAGYIPPTDFIDENTTLNIDGLKLDVFYTGGEALSEFGVYIPGYDLMIIADEFFYSQANVHSIRGSKPRIPDNYISALDRIREINPEWLLGSHIIPIQGKEEIQKIATISRDAIQYLWDQSIRYINKGYTATELQHKLQKLPDYLYLEPYTAPMYGAPYTSVPEFYNGWVSWFQGDATDLFPDHPLDEAKKMIALIGGRDKVLAAAEDAFNKGDAKFGARLTQYLVRVDKEDMQARYLKAACLKKLGYAEMNQISRSWYLTGAKELEGKVNPQAMLQRGLKTLMDSELPPKRIFENWRYLIDAEKAQDKQIGIRILFTDINQSWTLQLRNSILEIKQASNVPVANVVKTTMPQFNEFKRDGVTADRFSVDKGSMESLASLYGMLDLKTPAIYMHMR